MPFRTDVTVRGSLNAGLLPSAGAASSSSSTGKGAAATSSSSSTMEPSSDEYLDKFAEDLNRKIDSETMVLVEGLQACVELSRVASRDKFKAAQDALESELKAESMVRATESLLSLSHTLKLLFLLNTEDKGHARVQEDQAQLAERELAAVKREVEGVLDQIRAGR